MLRSLVMASTQIQIDTSGDSPLSTSTAATASSGPQFGETPTALAERRAEAERPQTLDVLVLDAALRQSLACTRSLGRVGLRIGLAEWDPLVRIPAFRSRWSQCNVTFPNVADDPDEFGAAVLAFVQQQRTTVVIPASDGSVAALRPWRDRLAAAGAQLALASEAALTVADDKARTLSLCTELGIPIPRTASIDKIEDVRSGLAEVGYPAVVKPTQSWPRRRGIEQRLQSHDVVDEREAVAAIGDLMAAGATVVAQEWVPGRREGVMLFYAAGQVSAEFAYIEHRTVPILGGASVVRESIPVPADVRESAVALVQTLDLEGYSVIEFRRNAAGQPVLMEINARLSGSVELAMRCGVDFPKMLWQWATNQLIDTVGSYRSGVRMRWLHGDLRWLRATLMDRGRPDSLPPTRAIGAFVSSFFQRGYYDGFDLHDLRPFLTQLRATLSSVHSRTMTDGRRTGVPDWRTSNDARRDSHDVD